MLKISEFFKKIQGKQAKEMLVRSIFQSVVKKNAEFDIPLENFSFKEESVVLTRVNQSQKSQIFIKKIQIINDFNSMQEVRKIKDIR